MNITAEEREVTTTKLFVTVNGDEFEAARVLDFVRSIMGTDGFMTGIHATGREKDLAETLRDCDAVGHTHSAGWHETDEEALDTLFTEVMVLYYDDLDRDDINPEDYR